MKHNDMKISDNSDRTDRATRARIDNMPVDDLLVFWGRADIPDDVRAYAQSVYNKKIAGRLPARSPQSSDNTAQGLLSGVPCPNCKKPNLSPWQRSLGERAVQGLGALVARAATIAVTGSDLLGNIVAYGPAMDALKGTDGIKCSACGITLELDVRALVKAHQDKIQAEERKREAMTVTRLQCPHCGKAFGIRHLLAPESVYCPGCKKSFSFAQHSLKS